MAPTRSGSNDSHALSGWVAERDTAAVEALRLRLLRAAVEADDDAADEESHRPVSDAEYGQCAEDGQCAVRNGRVEGGPQRRVGGWHWPLWGWAREARD